jgi:hypothetical protein
VPLPDDAARLPFAAQVHLVRRALDRGAPPEALLGADALRSDPDLMGLVVRHLRATGGIDAALAPAVAAL